MFSGVFDVYPRLKIILGHLGEGLPFAMHRLHDHSYQAAVRRGLKKTPLQYIKDNLVVTTSGNWYEPVPTQNSECQRKCRVYLAFGVLSRDNPILNSPYESPARHWELDEAGQPTQKVIEVRRGAKFVTPIPKPKKRKAAAQTGFVFDEGKGLSTKEQQYDPTSIINEVRGDVEAWRLSLLKSLFVPRFSFSSSTVRMATAG